ncbi:plasmid-partitioning protein SopA [Klebsiella pneumoniae]|nr:plasmid-partitioning protein SopA [Klebsiella pneumoniae]
MGLMDILNQCITAGHEMTKAIAIAQFNDDSPEARKITRRWRIGEAADLVGVSLRQSGMQRKPAGYLTLIWKPVAELNNVLVIPSNKSIICGMCSVPDCGVQKMLSLR